MALRAEEEAAIADVRDVFSELFTRAERARSAALEIVARGKLEPDDPNGLSQAVIAVVGSIYAKACKTFRAVQLLCEAGLGQDAAVLARQLFESAVALRFILQQDSMHRAAMYAAHEDQRLLVLVEEASQSSELSDPALVAKARNKASSWDEVIGTEVVRSVRHSWSGEGLQTVATKVGLQQGYTFMYRYTSAFAHGSDVTSHVFENPCSGVLTLKLLPGRDQIDPVLTSCIALLAGIATELNVRLGLGEDEAVERIVAEVRPLSGDAS